jgi:hypothetical protein
MNTEPNLEFTCAVVAAILTVAVAPQVAARQSHQRSDTHMKDIVNTFTGILRLVHEQLDQEQLDVI